MVFYKRIDIFDREYNFVVENRVNFHYLQTMRYLF
jgi:hypothetical protein